MVLCLISAMKCTFGHQQNRSSNPDQSSLGPQSSPDDRQHSQHVCTSSQWDVTPPIQSDITNCSETDVRLLAIRPTRPRSAETRASQKAPRDTEDDHPELGPLGDGSHFTEEAVLGNGEWWSNRNADDSLLSHDRTGLRVQTSSCYNYIIVLNISVVFTLHIFHLHKRANSARRVHGVALVVFWHALHWFTDRILASAT